MGNLSKLRNPRSLQPFTNFELIAETKNFRKKQSKRKL